MTKLSSLVMVMVMSGCVFGSRKARYIESGVVMGAGVVVASVPFWKACPQHDPEGCAPESIALLGGGGLILLTGLLGVIVARFESPNATPAEVQAGQYLDYASNAARYGDCATAIANARKAATVDAPTYDRRVAGDASLAGCLRAAP
jgi:hypothetical protein